MAEEDLFLLVKFVLGFIVLVDEILNNIMELLLHTSHLWRDHVPEGLVHHWRLPELHLDRVIKFYEVLAVWHWDFVRWHNRFEKYVFRLVLSHLGQVLRLLELILVIGVVVWRDLGHQRPAFGKDLHRSMSCTSRFSHLLALLFCRGESVNAEDLPGTCLEIFSVIQQDVAPLLPLELFDVSVHLRGLVRLLEVFGDLEGDFGEEFGGLLLFGRELIKQILRLRQHERAQRRQPLSREI